MKMMHGAFCSAWANRSRTRAAPTPTNISTNSESAEAEKRHLRLACDRAGEQRLAGARRTDQEHALGNPPAECRVLLGVLQEFDNLLQLLLGFVHAGHVREAHLHIVLGEDAVLAAGKRHHAAFSAAHTPEEKAPERKQQQDGNDPADDFGKPPAHELTGVLDAGGIELFEELGIFDPGGVEVAAAVDVAVERAADRLLANDHFGNLSAAYRRLELAVRDLTAGRREEPCLRERHQHQEPEHVPDRAAGSPRARKRSPFAGTFVPGFMPGGIRVLGTTRSPPGSSEISTHCLPRRR